MILFARRTMLTGMAAAAILGQAAPVLADETPIRVAYVLADSMLPALYAEEKGYFVQAGLKPEFISVQGGPAAVSAVASGEADIGYAAPIPPINARLNGVPMKMFLQLGQEATPDHTFIWLVTSTASGVTDLAGLKGKKIAINANGGLCDLMWRDHLATVGMSIKDVELLVLPFPEQEAALQLGNIDATCTFNPFYSSMLSNAELGAVTIGNGMLADLSEPLMSDAIFATDDWLGANMAVAATFAQVMDKARKELLADRPALEAAAVAFMELTPEAATSFNLPIINQDMTIPDGEVQRILDAMVKTGMHPGPLSGSDFSVAIAY